MKIKVIIPNSGMDRSTLDQREEMLSKYAWPGTEIFVDCITGGPESIESAYDEVLACPYVTEQAIKAEKAGFDAIIVYCGSDPAVAAAREIVNIPVIGPGKASKMLAFDLGYKFSVLTVLDDCIVRDREAVYEKGFSPERLASVRAIGIPVSNVRDNMEESLHALCEAGRKCMEDGADCIVLSCLGMAGLGEDLLKRLGISVIKPAFTVIKFTELLVDLYLNFSRKRYIKYF